MQKSIENYVLELLQERSLRKDYEKQLKDYIKALTVTLKQEPTKKILSSVASLACPIESKGDKLQYHPPTKVFMSGGFSWGSGFLSETMDVDVVVEIPKACIHSKDHLNEGVLQRRALYLQHLAVILLSSAQTNNNPSTKTSHNTNSTSQHIPANKTPTEGNGNLVGRLTYEYRYGLRKVPLLVVYPAEGPKHTRVIIDTCLPDDTFKLSRFHARKNNVRARWYHFKTGDEEAEKMDFNCVSLDNKHKEPLSSRYNNWVLEQLTTHRGHHFVTTTLEGFFAVKQAVVLLKLWMERRDLHKAFPSGLFVTFFTCHLVQQGILKRHHSVLQNFKIILQHLANGKLRTEGVSLAGGKGGEEEDDHQRPSMEELMSVDDVVLVDPSGYLNLCHGMLPCLYQDLCYEAERTMKVLASCQLDRFQAAFLNKQPLICKFDRILHITADQRIKDLCYNSTLLQPLLVDHAGNPVHAFLPTLLTILSRALEGRLVLLTFIPAPPLELPVSQKYSEQAFSSHISLGLILNHLTAYSHQVLGPFSDRDDEIHEFQKFWGERSEQVRFMGGEIREVVRWGADNIADTRTVVSRIVKFVLSRHFGISKEFLFISDNQLDGLLKGVEKKNASDLLVYGTGEEQIEDVMKSLDKLSKALRSLADLPLKVNTVQGISAVFRYSEVFPPVRSTCQSDAGVFKFMLVPLQRNNCPQHFPSYRVVCMLEGSSKWTDDLQALSKLKAAFYGHMGKQLKQHHSYSVLIYPDKLLLHSPPETFVFELRLGIGKEMQLARKVVLENGMVQMLDTPLYKELNFTYNTLPVYTSLLHGIQQKNNSFSGSLRLAKRWQASQLLGGFIPDGAVELLVAHAFVASPPNNFHPPSSPFLGFVRFLHLVSTHDWKLDPLIVNLNDEFKETDYGDIEAHFQAQRPQLPAMFICTPMDRKSEMWTLKKPTAVMLTRLVLAAQASLDLLSHFCSNLAAYHKKDFKQLFRPPTEDYNVLLHLDLFKCSRYHQGVDFSFDSSHPPPKRIARSESLFPVVDFDPALTFLEELKSEFDSFALFFFDVYGGTYIAIAWKPSAFKPVPYEDGASKYYKVLEDTLNAEQAMMIASEELILKSIRHLGSLIVKRTEIINPLF